MTHEQAAAKRHSWIEAHRRFLANLHVPEPYFSVMQENVGRALVVARDAFGEWEVAALDENASLIWK